MESMSNVESIHPVGFPWPTDAICNMMPIVAGDPESIPSRVRQYWTVAAACACWRERAGEVVYLTTHESWVRAGETQRRPGIHTDGTSEGPWGGGNWGRDGIWLASTDGLTGIWDEQVQASDVDAHGALRRPPASAMHTARAGWLYRITDRTPHETLPAEQTHYRQFFRLVGPEIHGWYAQHSTPNALGVAPRAPIIYGSKFA